jgi:hypothetical protein
MMTDFDKAITAQDLTQMEPSQVKALLEAGALNHLLRGDALSEDEAAVLKEAILQSR